MVSGAIGSRIHVRELLNAKGNPDTEEDDEGKGTMVGIAAEEEYLERMDAAKWHVSFWDYILEPLEGEIFQLSRNVCTDARFDTASGLPSLSLNIAPSFVRRSAGCM